MWINPISKKVYKLHTEIRTDFPGMSLPASITADVIASLGLLRVIPTTRPEGIIVEELEPALLDNTWTQQWLARPPTEAETAAKAAEVRNARDPKLLESDWVVARAYEQGTPIPEAWITYRQALRDITQQPGFPWTITWPTL